MYQGVRDGAELHGAGGRADTDSGGNGAMLQRLHHKTGSAGPDQLRVPGEHGGPDERGAQSRGREEQGDHRASDKLPCASDGRRAKPRNRYALHPEDQRPAAGVVQAQV